MPGKARWGQVWWADLGLDENKRIAVVSENGWNELFSSVIGVRLSPSPRRDPGPGFPLVSERPRVIAICGQVTSFHEDALVEPVGALSPAQMRAIAVGLLEVTQLHRLLGIAHPEIADRIGERRRR
ncbi:MAG: type II toxin-antitoxin system PemK/MazF family toxin [Gaiellaceae bacterium]